MAESSFECFIFRLSLEGSRLSKLTLKQGFSLIDEKELEDVK